MGCVSQGDEVHHHLLSTSPSFFFLPSGNKVEFPPSPLPRLHPPAEVKDVSLESSSSLVTTFALTLETREKRGENVNQFHLHVVF